jgi:periplasmic protein TonB
MKTQSEHGQRWEDIIFENRNKAYGAYAIRKNNNADVLKAEAISIGIGILIFIIPILIPDDKIVVPVIEEPTGGLELKEYVIETTPPPAPQPPMRRVDASIIPTTVTSDPVPDEPIVETPPTAGSAGTEGGEENTGSDVVVTTGSGIGTEPVVEAPKVYTYVAVMPEFEGGYKEMMKFLQRNVRYPRPAERRGAEGTVYVSFVIGPDGSVINALVEKGFDRDCDAEAVRVVSKMNKWKPGIQNNTPVFVKMVLPIKFKLEK